MLWGSPRSHMESANGGQFRLQDHRPSWVSASGTHLLGMWWAILAVDPSARLVHLSWQYLEPIGAALQSCVQVQCCEQINDSRGIQASALLSKQSYKASLVAQWLRIRLPMQGTRVRALVWEDPTCRGATRPLSHSYWACASGACAPQQEKPR